MILLSSFFSKNEKNGTFSSKSSNCNNPEQPPEVFCEKMCSEKFCKFHRKTPALESLFNKNRLEHGRFPVKFAKFLRTHILKDIYGRLLQ